MMTITINNAVASTDSNFSNNFAIGRQSYLLSTINIESKIDSIIRS